MNWELIGWIAIVASGAIVLASFLLPQAKTIAASENAHSPAGSTSTLHLLLEIAWPIFFIAVMGMLTLKEVLGFAAVLLLATVITGSIWLIDGLIKSKIRAKDSGEPVLVEMARSFFPVILIVFLLRSFLYEPFKIPSGSMEPTLLVGDFILVNKYTFGVRVPVINKKIMDVNLPQRGDVMVFRYPINPGRDYIKRVVGIPGDTVTYQNKQLIINGKAVKQEKAGIFTQINQRLEMRQFEVFKESLSDKPHTMMVDSKAAAFNLGGVFSKFAYKNNCAYNEDGFSCTVPPGNYFMMGDSRDNSEDGRYWGFVPEENIVGKAVLVWMNFSAIKRVGTTIE